MDVGVGEAAVAWRQAAVTAFSQSRHPSLQSSFSKKNLLNLVEASPESHTEQICLVEEGRFGRQCDLSPTFPSK